jgi:putative transposase
MGWRTSATEEDGCFQKLGGKPRLKGVRNKLNRIPFPDPIQMPQGNRVFLPRLGRVRFHKMELPEGRIKCGRMVKRASGWHLCLFIEAEPKKIARIASGVVGIDPGFSNLLTTSDGEVVEHPREFEQAERRLAQAQRGPDGKLAARIQERIGNRRKDRNHKLSRRLVAENVDIFFSKDNHKGMAKRFGKSVSSSGHAQLRHMLAYKSRPQAVRAMSRLMPDSPLNRPRIEENHVARHHKRYKEFPAGRARECQASHRD